MHFVPVEGDFDVGGFAMEVGGVGLVLHVVGDRGHVAVGGVLVDAVVALAVAFGQGAAPAGLAACGPAGSARRGGGELVLLLLGGARLGRLLGGVVLAAPVVGPHAVGDGLLLTGFSPVVAGPRCQGEP